MVLLAAPLWSSNAPLRWISPDIFTVAGINCFPKVRRKEDRWERHIESFESLGV